ncbi:MAG: hypothetical protein ACRDPM_00040 [Solirubrobacteraceae bacterium]
MRPAKPSTAELLMHRRDCARRRVRPPIGDKEVFGSAGSHDRIRLLAGVRANARFATQGIARRAADQSQSAVGVGQLCLGTVASLHAVVSALDSATGRTCGASDIHRTWHGGVVVSEGSIQGAIDDRGTELLLHDWLAV